MGAICNCDFAMTAIMPVSRSTPSASTPAASNKLSLPCSFTLHGCSQVTVNTWTPTTLLCNSTRHSSPFWSRRRMFAPVISTFLNAAGIFSRNSFTGAFCISWRTSARPVANVSVNVNQLTTSARTHESMVSVATVSFHGVTAGTGSLAMNL